MGQLRDAVRDVERAETEANRFKADANQVKAELKDELKKNDDMKLRITELESQKAQVEAEAAAARQVVSFVCYLSITLCNCCPYMSNLSSHQTSLSLGCK